jgi:hypothetical protein
LKNEFSFGQDGKKSEPSSFDFGKSQQGKYSVPNVSHKIDEKSPSIVADISPSIQHVSNDGSPVKLNPF